MAKAPLILRSVILVFFASPIIAMVVAYREQEIARLTVASQNLRSPDPIFIRMCKRSNPKMAKDAAMVRLVKRRAKR